MRRLVIVLVVLVGLLVVADRVAVLAADRVVAGKLQSQERLDQRPSVSIGGFPFLTQAIGGRYSDVTVTLHDVHRTAVRIDTLSVHLRGVHVPLSAVFSQHLSRVPIDHATAVVTLTYADLNAYLSGKGLTLSSAGGDRVRATGSVTVRGQKLSASGTVGLNVSSDALVLQVAAGVTANVPLGGLPFGITLRSARATNQGILLTATASGLVVRPQG